MFELNSKIRRVEYYFREIITEFNFVISLENSHEVQLKSTNCIVTFTTERYYSDLQMTFRKPLSSKEYSITEVLMKMNLMGKKVFNEIEQRTASEIEDELENGLYSFAIIAKKYLSDLLRGDFSLLDDSEW